MTGNVPSLQPDKIPVKYWDPSEERAKGKIYSVSKINSELDDIELKINDTIRYLRDIGEELTADKIKSRFSGKSEKPVMLLDVFEEHNRKVAALVNQEFAPGTVTRYETTLKQASTQNEFTPERRRVANC